jgi:TPR repeat protein
MRPTGVELKYTNRPRVGLIRVFLIFLVTTSTLFADYQAGLEAYQEGDYGTAILEWQAVVESPPGKVSDEVRAEALYAIGMLFWLGQGVQQDTAESASWLQLAAQLQHPGAQTKLAFLYSTGQGVKQSTFEALKWWQMAASQGDPDAQYNLGVAYRDGLGVEPDADVSLKWFREAAANGNYLASAAVENFEQTGSLLTANGTRITPSTGIPPNTQGVAIAGDTAQGMAAPEPEMRPSQTLPAARPSDEDWIRQRDPANYTIQVIALSQEKKLKDYIDQHPEWAPFAIYAQRRYEQPLWVLVQGEYPDVESARRAVREFPEDMQARDKLWIRRFEMVQGLLE